MTPKIRYPQKDAWFCFHEIKFHFKTTYQLMRVASEQRTLREWTIFSVCNGKGEGLQPSGALGTVMMNTSSSSAWKCF